MTTTEPDFAGASWLKSSFSGGGNGQCVEVGRVPGWVGVRDSKDNGAGPVLNFTEAEWAAFLAGARAGEFDGC